VSRNLAVGVIERDLGVGRTQEASKMGLRLRHDVQPRAAVEVSEATTGRPGRLRRSHLSPSEVPAALAGSTPCDQRPRRPDGRLASTVTRGITGRHACPKTSTNNIETAPAFASAARAR
jgi:hypothetical protein